MCRVTATLLSVFGLATLAGAEENFECGRAYQDMLRVIEAKQSTLSPQAEVVLRRRALRLYDACLTGDLEHPGELFAKLDRTGY